MSRLVFCLILCIATPTRAFQKLPQLSVNQERLEQRINTLADFGKQANGETERVAFSDADLEAREWVITILKELHLDVSIDFAGNIIGKRKGEDPTKKPIAFGSHIDRVPQGGNYDGCVGSMAALEIIDVLNSNKIKTQHPLELIIFSNEEGGVMGSKALAGDLTSTALNVVNSTGYAMGEGVMRLGGDTSRIKEVTRKPGDLAAFLELHIEQGGILEQKQIEIGVVEGIVGLQWWDVEFTGFANHAGTTPMNMRKDALLAASKFIIAVNEITTGFEGKQVGTVGRIKVEPGAPNVIPGKAVATLEIRDLSSEVMQKVYQAIEIEGQKIAKDAGLTITFKPLDVSSKPALTDKGIQNVIKKVSQQLGLSTMPMQSGAGHDAQEMATLTRTGMIFIPSKGGISHSPKEFSSANDMAKGANVLLHTLLLLDKE